MELKPIRSEEQYEAALREVSAYFDHEPKPGTEEGERFEALLMLIEKYEAAQYLIGPASSTEDYQVPH